MLCPLGKLGPCSSKLALQSSNLGMDRLQAGYKGRLEAGGSLRGAGEPRQEIASSRSVRTNPYIPRLPDGEVRSRGVSKGNPKVKLKGSIARPGILATPSQREFKGEVQRQYQKAGHLGNPLSQRKPGHHLFCTMARDDRSSQTCHLQGYKFMPNYALRTHWHQSYEATRP